MPGSSLENYFPKAHLYLTGLRVYSVWKAFSPEALSKTISSDCLTQQQPGAVRTLGTKTSCQKSSNEKPENEMFKGLLFLSINKILGIWKVICMYKGCVPAPSCASDVEETQRNRTNVKKNLLINLLRRYGATQGKLSWRSSGSSTAPKISSLLTRPIRDKGAFRMLRSKWQFTRKW